MSDWQPPQPYAPPMGEMPPTEPKPKRTGLIIVIVVIVLLLMCCCMGVIGVLLFSASSGKTSSPPTSTTVPTDPKEAKRLAEWETAKAAFPLTGYTTVAPNARQKKLADAATQLLFPDFTLDKLLVQPGSYDAKKRFFTFDEYIVLMHLKSNPSGVIARAYSVTQPAADSLARKSITVESNEALDRLDGTSWVHYDTDKVPPLMKSTKDTGVARDPKYAELVVNVAEDWPGGVVVRLQPQSDGSAKVRVFTWESYSQSDANEYVDVVYAQTDGVWEIRSYDVVTGSAESTPTAPTP